VRRLPSLADDGLSDGGNSQGSHRFVSGLAENTNSIFCTDSSESQTANGCPVLRRAGTISREAYLRAVNPESLEYALSRARPGHCR
jgi:hypothetical protein